MRIEGSSPCRVAVLGFRRTGRAVAAHVLAAGGELFVSEAGTLSEGDRRFLSRAGAGFEEGGHTPACLAGADLVVPSPAVPPDHPILEEACARGVPVRSELELAASLLGEVPLIAVTGTNGKSTTARMIASMLLEEHGPVVLAGNIGVPLIAVIGEARAASYVVVEVSSFQLAQSHALRSHVALLLNVTPDHIDYHRSFARYVAAKRRLFEHQEPSDWAILPSGLESMHAGSMSRVRFYDREPIGPEPVWRGLAPHNVVNLRAAVCACRVAEDGFDLSAVDPDVMKEAARLPHRLVTVGEVNGVQVIDDSKSTNAASTIAALATVDRPTVLLLGGRHKEQGYDDLARSIATSDVRRVVLFGEAAAFLGEKLAAAGVHPVERCRSLTDATRRGLEIARRGELLLLSPGCSSLDAFRSYARRGRAFSRIVRRAAS